MPATTEPLGASASSRSLSRLRPGKHDATTPDNDSTPSLASRTSSLGDDSSDVTSTMDGAIDKVRERARKSVDERRGSEESASGARLSALLGRGARKLKRKEKNNTNINNGASTLGVNHSGESGELAFSDGRSEGSLLDEDDANSSLLTDDGSENDGYVWTPFLLPPYSLQHIPTNIHASAVLWAGSQWHARVSIGMLQLISTCASQPNANLPRALSHLVSRYDLPRSLHLANAPTRMLGIIITSLPVDVGFLTISFLLLYNCQFL